MFDVPLDAFFSSAQLASSKRVVAGRRNTWCEIYGPYRVSGGFGKYDAGERGYGRVRCAVTVSARGNEAGFEGEDVKAVTTFEFVFAPSVRVDPKCRLFVPARFPTWSPDTAMQAGQMVVGTKWTKGETPVFRCEKAGRTAFREPTWPTRLRSRFNEGSITWRLVGFATVFEVVSSNSDETQNIETIVRAEKLE